MGDLEKNYLQGNCDALAIALAVHFDAKIIAFHPIRHTTDGERIFGRDFLHVCIQLPSGDYMDARGVRSLDVMLQDFQGLMDLVKGDAEKLEVHQIVYDSAEEFMAEANIDPSRNSKAYDDALHLFPELLDPDLVEMTRREIANVSSSADEESYSLGF